MAKTKADGGGLRYDNGKVRLELLPPEWIVSLGEVTTRGSVKYPARNWERGMSHGKMIGCALRHIFKYLMGERYDTKPDAQGNPGTGCHHLAQAAWNLLALMFYDVRGIGDADLPDAPNNKGGCLPTWVEPEKGKSDG